MQIENIEMDSTTFTGSRRRPLHILGAGGVGSNLFAIFLENLEQFTCKIYDHDTIEPHNLNRSYVFSTFSIGKLKVKALEELHRMCTINGVEAGSMQPPSAVFSEIWQGSAPFPVAPQIRSDLEPYGTAFNSSYATHNYGQLRATMVGKAARINRDNFNPASVMGVIIDARDSTDPNIVIDRTYLKLAYNGGSELSFHFGPAFHRFSIWDIGGDNSYEVVPSFFVPAALLSEFTYFFLQYISPKKITKTRACIHKIDIDEELDDVMYDASSIYEEEE